VEEIAAYCRERKNGIDPERFWNHYEANGWVQGRGKPIKNWKAAVVTWEKNGLPNGTPASGKPTKSAEELAMEMFREGRDE
jgi:hypothetical protein